MKKNKNIFLGKKILIYGLGKSGISTFKFLRNKANTYLFDDNLKKNQKFISLNKIPKKNFDLNLRSNQKIWLEFQKVSENGHISGMGCRTEKYDPSFPLEIRF